MAETPDKMLHDIKLELDEHLEALNQNTAEISATNEYLSELDLRLSKLAERVDALQALILAQTPTVKSVRLSPAEEQVVGILLSSTAPLTSREIAQRVGQSSDGVAQLLYAVKMKGVPLLTSSAGEEKYYALDAAFKALQQGRVILPK
jgi:hypothetical protein